MSNLEAELGVRLFHRSTSQLVLTPAGEELSRRARRIQLDAQEAWSAVRRLDDVPRGVLRVVDRVVVGSPDYFARRGQPASVEDLVGHRCITGITQSWPLRAGGEVVVEGTAQVSVVFADRDYTDAKVRVFIDRAVPVLEAKYGGGVRGVADS